MVKQAPEALPQLQAAEEKPQSPLRISDDKDQLDANPSSAKGEAEQAARVESPSSDYVVMPDQSQKNRVDSNKPSLILKDGKFPLLQLNFLFLDI